MTLQQLQYLIAIAESNSINQAAQSLFVSQSSISKAVKQLEEELGFALLDRSYRGISFTPAAQSVLKPEDIGIGTSMINFANSLSASVAAAIYSAIYGFCTASGVTADTVQKGVNGVFLTAGIVTVVGVVLVLTKIRPMLEKDAAVEG